MNEVIILLLVFISIGILGLIIAIGNAAHSANLVAEYIKELLHDEDK